MGLTQACPHTGKVKYSSVSNVETDMQDNVMD